MVLIIHKDPGHHISHIINAIEFNESARKLYTTIIPQKELEGLSFT